MDNDLKLELGALWSKVTKAVADAGGTITTRWAVGVNIPLAAKGNRERIMAGLGIAFRVDAAMKTPPPPAALLLLGRDAERFLCDPKYLGEAVKRRVGIQAKAGTYGQQLLRGTLLLAEFERLAGLHPRDPHWTNARLFAEIGKNYGAVVAKAGVPSDRARKCLSGEAVKKLIIEYLPKVADDTATLLDLVRRDAEEHPERYQ